MEFLEPQLRGAIVGFLFLIAILFVQSAQCKSKSYAVIAVAITIGGIAIGSSPIIPESVSFIIAPLCSLGLLSPLALLWACAEIFVDDFKPNYINGSLIAFLLILPVIPGVPFFVVYLHHIVSLGIFAVILYIAISTAESDLVKARRVFRKWCCISVGLTGVVFIGLEFLYEKDEATLHPFRGAPDEVRIFKVIVIFILSLMFLLWATRTRSWVSQSTGVIAQHKSSAAEDLSVKDRLVLERIQQNMESGIWKQEGLSIRDLAITVDAQEHHLRRLINRELGYRNFAAFINERRIKEAATMLSQPAAAESTILSIAFENGFASLGPFNRAFREVFGMSPTEYRDEQLGNG